VVYANGPEAVIPDPAAQQCGEGHEPAFMLSHLAGGGAAGSRLTSSVQIKSYPVQSPLLMPGSYQANGSPHPRAYPAVVQRPAGSNPARRDWCNPV
jgi:hypothetical protein